jgi:hypothetical protein
MDDPRGATVGIWRAPGVGAYAPPRVLWLDFPEELRHVCEPYLLANLSILPRWVNELRVQFDTQSGSAMRVTVHHEYRCGNVWFCADWFTCTDAYRHSAIRHEFAHFPHEVLSAFCRTLIDTFNRDDRFQAHLREDLRVALEMATTDVEEMLTAALALGQNALNDPERRTG